MPETLTITALLTLVILGILLALDRSYDKELSQQRTPNQYTITLEDLK